MTWPDAFAFIALAALVLWAYVKINEGGNMVCDYEMCRKPGRRFFLLSQRGITTSSRIASYLCPEHLATMKDNSFDPIAEKEDSRDDTARS